MIAARSLVAMIPAFGLVAAAGAADGPNLKQAEAEADRLDPGWRLADLQAKRPKIPPAQDGGARVLEVFRAMPQEWKEVFRADRGPGTVAGVSDALRKAIADDPTRPIPPDVVAAAKAHRTKAAPLLARARDLEKIQAGRYEITLGRNPLALLLPHIQDARTVAMLLQFDALARAAAGDIDGALGSARAILGVARSIGDEPLAISQLVRMAITNVATDVIERSLARGQASDAALAATQAALAAEAAQPLALFGLRGERAVTYDVMDKLASGTIKLGELTGQGLKLPPGLGDAIPDARGDQAIALHLMNLAVEIAKKPPHEQPALWERWDRDIPASLPADRERHPLVYLLMPVGGSLSDSYLRTRALLRSAETMVGLERVRRARGHWPKPGESLAPAFKDAPPADPLTGRPMLWKTSTTGLVVYSAGFDRSDSGGKLDIRNFKAPGIDIGLRLWDVDRRPRPARSR